MSVWSDDPMSFAVRAPRVTRMIKEGFANMKTVRDVSKISGVSRRTLQYYDEIGLLKPDGVKPSGYRLYSEDNLARLWRILFYRDLGFSLDEIKKMLSKSPELEQKLMQEHRHLLTEKQNKLKKMIASIDLILEGAFDESMLSDFDTRAFEEKKKNTQKIADRKLTEDDPFYDFLRPLIQYKLTTRGGVASMIRNIGSATNLDWDNLRLDGEPLGRRFVDAMAHGPQSPQAMTAVEHFVRFAESHLSACDRNVLSQIANMYVKEAPAVDKTHAGLAQFVADAIQHCCKNLT